MHKQGNLDYTCFKGHGVDELSVSCRESEMSPGKLAVCAVDFILKETLSSDMGHKAAVLFHIAPLNPTAFSVLVRSFSP